MSYDRGQAAGITKIAPGQYAVDSWREEGTTYIVQLDTEACSCPLNSRTGTSCKHIKQARAYRFQQITEKAKSLPTERLEELKEKWFGKDKAIWLAIDGELFDRYEAQMREGLRTDRQAAQQQSRDQQLKQIFA